jgi:hypothetical protein
MMLTFLSSVDCLVCCVMLQVSAREITYASAGKVQEKGW